MIIHQIIILEKYIMKYNKIKLGSKVLVVSALREHNGYVHQLNDLVGTICTVRSVDHTVGKCRVESTNYGSWWFPLACVIHVNDRRGITKTESRIGLCVTVFSLGILTLDIDVQTFTTPPTSFVHMYRSLCGKPAMIVSDIKPPTYVDDDIRNVYFVDVKVNGNVYNLPLSSLRTLEPEYKAREINYGI